ncbi:hypothetical protein BHE74_00033755 [Ensete ventricosum]|nr:hypothetical protein BHE74_00033755 [Ensete ventricosum]
MKERIPSDGAEELVELGFRLGLHADDDDEGDEAVVDPSNARDQLSKGGKKRGEESGAEMGGGMEVNKNKYIEDWNAARENLELNFRWTRRNLAIVGIFGLAVPILVYKGIVREFVPISSSSPSPCFFSRFHMQDEDAGRPPRKFL